MRLIYLGDGDQIKENGMGGTYSTNDRREINYKILVGKTDWKKCLGGGGRGC
jgi:hypothetical protein